MSIILNEQYDKPLRASCAIGCNIKVNGRWLLDTSMGCGTHIFGHDFIRPFLRKFINDGSLFALPNVYVDECARLLHEATGFTRFVFAASGSEATTKAIRIARAYTGRTRIALFEGHWHGTQDYNLVSYSNGIPQAVKDQVDVLPFNDIGLEMVKCNKYAIVMLEAVQGACPVDRRHFLKVLREVTNDSGTILCFDEVVTGFRFALGGATEYFGVVPDIVCYGKIIGGGLPVGVIAGHEVMDVVKQNVRMGGTFSANPLTVRACIEVLKELIRSNPYKDLYMRYQSLAHVKSSVLQVKVVGMLARLIFTPKTVDSLADRKHELPLIAQDRIIALLRDMGIYIGSNRLILLSTLHTEVKTNDLISCLQSI